jgi:hypothetical protein
MTVTDYNGCVSEGPDYKAVALDLVSKVKAKLAEGGWKPQGGLTIIAPNASTGNDWCMIQPMIKTTGQEAKDDAATLPYGG